MQVRSHALDGGGHVVSVSRGPTTGPPVVVLSGLNEGIAPLDEAAAAQLPAPPRDLAHLRTHVIGYRHPLAPGTTTGELADDVATAMDDLTPDGAVVSGHSLGAFVALHLAARHPERVRGLLLSGVLLRPDDVFRSTLELWADLVVHGLFDDFGRETIAASYTGRELRRRRLLHRFARTPDLSEHVERYDAMTLAAIDHEAPNVARITVPVAVVAGGEDPLTRPQGSRELADLLPDATFVEVPGAAHGLPEQAPDAYAEAARGLLQRVGAVA